MVAYLLTANGKIKCARCTGKSSRTGEQCARPALRSSKSRKCKFHGGLSSGPKTEAGRQRIREANWVHGQRSAAAIELASKMAARVRHLADCVEILWGVEIYDLRGRKPNGYKALLDEEDVRRFLRELILEEML